MTDISTKPPTLVVGATPGASSIGTEKKTTKIVINRKKKDPLKEMLLHFLKARNSKKKINDNHLFFKPEKIWSGDNPMAFVLDDNLYFFCKLMAGLSTGTVDTKSTVVFKMPFDKLKDASPRSFDVEFFQRYDGASVTSHGFQGRTFKVSFDKNVFEIESKPQEDVDIKVLTYNSELQKIVETTYCIKYKLKPDKKEATNEPGVATKQQKVEKVAMTA